MINLKEVWLRGLTEEEAKELLQSLIEALDAEDEDDRFGTEGWRNFFGYEDEIP